MLLGAITVALALLWALAGGRGLHPRIPTVAWAPVLAAGLLGLFVIAQWQPGGSAGVAVALLAHTALLCVGIVNFRLPGVAALTAGVVANGAVILANGGMPVAADAVLAAGGSPAALPAAGSHHLLTDATHLPWLGDVVGIAWLDRVVSAGDALLLVGAVTLLTASLAGEVD